MPMNEYGEIIRNPAPPITPLDLNGGNNDDNDDNDDNWGSAIAIIAGIAILSSVIFLIFSNIGNKEDIHNTDIDNSNYTQSDTNNNYSNQSNIVNRKDYESENNNSFNSSNHIELNKQYYGYLGDSWENGEQDWFNFYISEPSLVSVSVTLPKQSDNETYWDMSIRDKDNPEDDVWQIYVKGFQSNVNSGEYKLNPGRYYFEIESSNKHSSEEYSFRIYSEIAKTYDTRSSYNSDYLLPNSDSSYISSSDLTRLSKEEVQLARNEIYARRGRKFDTDWIRDYFESKSWYNPEYDANNFSESVFNKYEKENIKTIVEYERSKGWE